MAKKITSHEETEGLVLKTFCAPKVFLRVVADTQPSRKLLNGRGVYDPDEKRFDFFQRLPPEKKSKVIKRTDHITFRRRDDGSYWGSFRFAADEMPRFEDLAAELRLIIKKVKDEH